MAIFRPLPTSDLNEIQLHIGKFLDDLNTLAAGWRKLEGVAVGTTSTRITHGMSRVPQEILIHVSDAAVVRAAASDSSAIYLSAASATTVNVYLR